MDDHDGGCRTRSRCPDSGLATVGLSMEAAAYDGWYDTPRGRWIGDQEYQLLLRQLAPQSGERLLDVGCGTGWFTRRLAAQSGLDVTGIDIDGEALEFARSHDDRANYFLGDACHLPFEDDSFDKVVSITALCFIADWPLAMAEIVRVCRHRFAIGLLNRHSLLWWEKGRHGGAGAYQGAHWHTTHEVRRALSALPVCHVSVASNIFLSSGSGYAHSLERCVPTLLPFGSFLMFAGDKRRTGDQE